MPSDSFMSSATEIIVKINLYKSQMSGFWQFLLSFSSSPSLNYSGLATLVLTFLLLQSFAFFLREPFIFISFYHQTIPFSVLSSPSFFTRTCPLQLKLPQQLLFFEHTLTISTYHLASTIKSSHWIPKVHFCCLRCFMKTIFL